MAATIIFPSIILFTKFIMEPVNDKLMEKAQSLQDKSVEAGAASDENVHALLDKWATLNLARAAITGLGSLLAIWAALDKREAAGASSFSFTTGANRIS
jgi:hypothetical protein